MPLPTALTDLSTTAASNYPASSDNIAPSLDDLLRFYGAALASIMANSGNGWTSPYIAQAGALTWNDAGAAVDARFEGDTDANLLFLDGSADNVGIGTATPSYKLHVVGQVVADVDSGPQFIADAASGSASTLRLGQASVVNWDIVNTATTGIFEIKNGSGYAFKSESVGVGVNGIYVDANGNVVHSVNGTAPTLGSNYSMSFELTSDTSLKIVVRGSDGVTRSVSLTLA